MKAGLSRILAVGVVAAAAGAAFGQPAPVSIESNVRQTAHNLSVGGTGPVKAQAQTEVCVFCHTPHGASAEPGAPLWNRDLSALPTYTTYLSSSIDATLINGQLAQPGGSSRLCLSCHDGTLAVGAVNVVAGQTGVEIAMTGTAADGTMPPGAGVSSGFTRDLGVDLSNDHPVSVTYDAALADRDGELRVPDNQQRIPAGTGAVVAIRDHASGVKPRLPLERTGPSDEGQIQCATCHDPHIRDTGGASIKFLRANRFQLSAPAGLDFDQDGDIICLACHDKDLNGAGWALSAHANPDVAGESYTAAAAATRDFPAGTPVWQASCLNCHDTHSVAGSRRLAREGTDDSNTPKQGGASAIEETCYQCHTGSGAVLASLAEVPDVESDFALTYHMPITTADQPAAGEVHDIGTGNDGVELTRRGIHFVEDSDLLGDNGNLDNRHVECTDCHNPHRVIRNRQFNGSAVSPDPAGTHTPPTNIASGVLRGSWGVEPEYSLSTSFHALPSGYQIKRGIGASTLVASGHVTREYQVCLKCHSDHGYADNNVYPAGNRPEPGDSGGTTFGFNLLDQYTNQAREFHAPLAHQGEGTASDSGAGSGYVTNNHRSWHPVIDATGRSLSTRAIGIADNPFRAPFAAAVGSQTMYCSDCHGSSTAADSIEPAGGENGASWGPHGSTNPFLLKGTWNAQTGGADEDVPVTDPANGVCFKCHEFRAYADRNGDDNYDSGFSGPASNNLHALHTDRINRMRCMWCHTAVPHGWKNKALLVNLNDVGPEAGLAAGTEVPINGDGATYDQGPYYVNTKLKIRTFATSGNWQASNCGSASGNPDVGRDWMKDVCANPP